MEDTTVSQARQENFLALFRGFRQEHAHLPDRGMLKAFAEKLGLSAKYLSHVKCGRKAIGHAVARQIEEALLLKEGWMDRRHTESEPVTNSERLLIEAMLTLHRGAPEEAQRVMLELVKQGLAKKPPAP